MTHNNDNSYVSVEKMKNKIDYLKVNNQNRSDIEGFFGPKSMVWKISREAVIFMGASTAALLQTAHPWVAQGVDDHSSVKHNPLERFHKTFHFLNTMIYGDVKSATEMSVFLHRMHSKVEGEMEENVSEFKQGEKYAANDVNALYWVQATLIDTSVKIYEDVIAPLTKEEKDQFVLEHSYFSYLFGISEESFTIPKNWNDFQTYYQGIINSGILEVSQASKKLANLLFFNPQNISFMIKPMIKPSNTLASYYMPAHIAKAYGLPEMDEANKRKVKSLIKRIRFIHKMLPAQLRYISAYHEAMCRLNKKSVPSYVKFLNTIYMGKPLLVNHEIVVAS